MTFYIPLLNPIRFTGGAGNKFDTELMIDLINRYQEKKCYFQKWNIGDNTKLQILSDWIFTFKIFDLETNEELENIVPVEFVTGIEGQTFKVYTVDIEFLESGYYYSVIQYDGNSLISEPWQISDGWESTILFKYRNSENNFSVVFDNDFEFDFRVEGLVANFEPKSDDVIYNDQLKNSRLLNSVPWRSFTMFIGNEEGLPDWVIDKANRIMSCDVVRVDSETFDGYISKVEGAEWEITRGNEQAFSGLRIEIMTVDNSLLERLKRAEGGGGTGENFTVVQKINNFFGVSTQIVLAGTFGKYRLLEKIGLEMNSGSPDLPLRIGTTNGGAEIAEFLISDVDAVLIINKLFLAETTLYLSGFTSELPFLSVIWKNLIENPAGTGVPASGNVPLGVIAIWGGVGGRVLSDDFNLTTGVGLEDTEYYGWAICNGSNGTPDLGERFVFGFKNTINADGNIGGEKEHTLSVAEMPDHSHDFQSALGNVFKRGNVGSAFFSGGVQATTEGSGGGEAHNNMPPYVVKAYIQKIF